VRKGTGRGGSDVAWWCDVTWRGKRVFLAAHKAAAASPALP